MQLLNAADFDHIRTGTADVRTTGIEELGTVHHMRFSCCVVDDGHTLGSGGGNHDIDGSTNARHVKKDVGPARAVFRPDVDITALCTDLSTQCLKALDVLVDGTNAKITAAGQPDSRLAETAKFRTEQIIRAAFCLLSFMSLYL